MSFTNENPNNTIKEISLPNGESYTFNAEYLDGKAFSDIVELINKAADMGFNLHICTKAEDTPYGVILDSGLESVTGTLVAEDAEKKTFYLVKSDKTKNDYDEYAVVDSFRTPIWEKIGSTEIDIDSLKKVFTRSESGMVPAPGAARPLSRTLLDNGSWSYNSMYMVYVDNNIPSDEFQKFAMEQQITLEKLYPYIGLGVMLVDRQSISWGLTSCIGIKINEDTRLNMGDGSTELTSVSFLLHIIIDAQSNTKEWVFATLDANGWTYTPIFQEVKNDVYVDYAASSYNIIKNAIDNKQMVYVRYGHEQPEEPLPIDWTEYPYSETIQTGQPAGRPKFRFSNGVNYFDVTFKAPNGNEITLWGPLTSCADQTIIEDSTNAVSGGAVYAALQDNKAFIADVGMTTYADVEDAIALGKVVIAKCVRALPPDISIVDYGMLADKTVDSAYIFDAYPHRFVLDTNGVWSVHDVVSSVVTQNDANAVAGMAVYTALQGKQDVLAFDDVPTEGSSNLLSSDAIYRAFCDSDKIFWVEYEQTPFEDCVAAFEVGKLLILHYTATDGNMLIDKYALCNSKITKSGVTLEQHFFIYTNSTDTILQTPWQWQKTTVFDEAPTANHYEKWVTSHGIYTALQGKVDMVDGKGLSTNDYTDEDKEKLAGIEQATDETLGLVKLNSTAGITLNDDGQLAVDGRFKQTIDGGLCYPQTAEPTNVGASSLLMTDGAKGLSAAPRTLSIMAGANLTCRSAVAGSTEYRIVNNKQNRFACAAVNVAGARLAIDAYDAATNNTAAILSIKYADGSDCVPHFGVTEPGNDIIITVDRTVNPDASTTKLRAYGTAVANDVISIGQGVTGHSKGLSIGQSCRTAKQQTVALGNSVYVTEINSFGFGKFIYVPKELCFAAGLEHDFTSASAGTSAFGQYSVIDADTTLAIGNGTASSNCSNAFEVKNNGDAVIGGGVILTSPNGTKYKLTVADDGTLTTAAV